MSTITAPPALPALSQRRREQITLAGITLVISVTAFEAIAVATAMPTVARSLHGLGLFGWSFTAFLLADIVGLVDAGSRVDRNGPTGSLIGGLSMFATGLLVDGLAPDMPVFLVGRALQGLGAGARGGGGWGCCCGCGCGGPGVAGGAAAARFRGGGGRLGAAVADRSGL